MIQVYYLLALLVIVDGIILCCKYVVDIPNKLDTELKPDLIIKSKFWDTLAWPLIFVIPFGWTYGVTETKKNLYALPYILFSFFAIILLIVLLKHRFKRFYLSDTGIVVYNLLSQKSIKIPIENILKYTYRTGYRSRPCYIVTTRYKKFSFSEGQIKDVSKFKAYFRKHNIQFYEYDSLTGYDYKK